MCVRKREKPARTSLFSRAFPYGLLLLPLALRFAFALRLALTLPLTERTPDVFSLPLSFVSTPVFDETLLRFAFAGMLALVSTAPCRAGLPAAFALFAFAPVLALSEAPQPLRAAAPMSTNASAKLRCIIIVPP